MVTAEVRSGKYNSIYGKFSVHLSQRTVGGFRRLYPAFFGDKGGNLPKGQIERRQTTNTDF